MRYSVLPIAAIAMLSRGCGGTSVSEAAIDAHAQWLCDVPRFSFDQPSGPAALLAETLAEAAVTEEDCAALLSAANGNAHIRGKIADAYHAECRGVS